jgi:hypothetical protein
MIAEDTSTYLTCPFATFFAIHFEVGGNTNNLEYQEEYWPHAVNLIKLADLYDARLTLQLNPQWSEYILQDKNKFDLLKEWQRRGHEVALHHHGYDHMDWNGYTNRSDKKDDPAYRGNIEEMMGLMKRIAHPYPLVSGTITDEHFDYPEGIQYDTEGIKIDHARTKPRKVILGKKEVIQVGMSYLPFDGDLGRYKMEFLISDEDEIFGLVTHESDFAENSKIIKDWLGFTSSKGQHIRTVSEIIRNYQKTFDIGHSDESFTFMKNVMGEL